MLLTAHFKNLYKDLLTDPGFLGINLPALHHFSNNPKKSCHGNAIGTLDTTRDIQIKYLPLR